MAAYILMQKKTFLFRARFVYSLTSWSHPIPATVFPIAIPVPQLLVPVL